MNWKRQCKTYCSCCLIMPPTEKQIIEVSRWIELKLALINPTYLAPPDTEAIELQYMKKSEKSKVKLQRKIKAEDLKRKLLDPNAGKEEADNQHLSVDVSSRVHDAEGAVEEIAEGFEGLGTGLGTSKMATKDEMKQALKVKISEMRSARKAPEAKAGRVKRTPADPAKKKVKSKEDKGAKKRKLDDCGPNTESERDGEGKQMEEEADKKSVRVEFGCVEEATMVSKAKKKKSKRQLLADAENRVERKKQFETSGVGGEDILKDEWDSALGRAQGEKLVDDPKVLKKNIDRTDKKKAKSAREWKERIKAVEVKMAKKRDRAKANLKARAQKKMDRRKMKRLKKLMG